ncbi:hypothetical protein TMatcc_010079 [Talaromyces marneffei ATCC 18224]
MTATLASMSRCPFADKSHSLSKGQYLDTEIGFHRIFIPSLLAGRLAVAMLINRFQVGSAFLNDEKDGRKEELYHDPDQNL